MSGRYEVKDDSIEVILEIRDQQLPETIPFRLITKSPKNCYSFTNRNYAEFRNNKFTPDSNITITIDSKAASIKFSKWANHCEEELSWQKEIVKVDNKVR